MKKEKEQEQAKAKAKEPETSLLDVFKPPKDDEGAAGGSASVV